MPGMLKTIEKKLGKLQEDVAAGRRPTWTSDLPGDGKQTTAARPDRPKSRGQAPSVLRKAIPPPAYKEPRPPASFDLEGDGAEPEPELATAAPPAATPKKLRRAAVVDPTGAKTVGVKLPADVYAAVRRLQEKWKCATIKETVLHAVRKTVHAERV